MFDNLLKQYEETLILEMSWASANTSKQTSMSNQKLFHLRPIPLAMKDLNRLKRLGVMYKVEISEWQY